MGDLSLAPTRHAAMAPGPPQAHQVFLVLTLSAPAETQCLLSRRALWRCPHCSKPGVLLKTRLCPVLPRQWGSGCQQALVAARGPTLRAHL